MHIELHSLDLPWSTYVETDKIPDVLGFLMSINFLDIEMCIEWYWWSDSFVKKKKHFFTPEGLFYRLLVWKGFQYVEKIFINVTVWLEVWRFIRKGHKTLINLNWSVFTYKFDRTKKLPVFNISWNPIWHVLKYFWIDPGGFDMPIHFTLFLFTFFISVNV